MANPTGREILVPLLTSYRDYFVKVEMDTFCGCYSTVLIPYKIDLVNAAATIKRQEFALQIYAAA